jgi:hypothetical protein
MRRAFSLLVLTLAAACGRPPASAPLAPATAACLILSADSAADTLTVAVAGPVDFSHAPVPATEAERFVFGAFYETLVRLDCDGRVEPGLARHWTRVANDGRRWQFTVRDDAAFWDGTRVTADDVVAAWAGRAGLVAESVSVLDARTLSVVLSGPDTTPGRLADPRLGIARQGAPGALPIGTGPYAVTGRSMLHLEARPVNQARPLLGFLLAAGADLRDLLDQGVDLVLTDDPETLRYASSRETFDIVSLPWSWTYVLVGGPVIEAVDALERWGLREAVRGDVRRAEPPFWWVGAPRCPGAAAGPGYLTPGMARTIAYVDTDPVARDIAERLAAVAGRETRPTGTGSLRALGLPPAEFADALQANRALAFITALARRSYDACLNLPAGGVVPLLDARSSVVARRGRVALEVEWDGTPRWSRP